MTLLPSQMIKVWDRPTRVIHLGLILGVSWCLISGFLLSATARPSHIWAGCGVLGLVLFRGIWGFYGGFHSRFRAFSLHPAALHRHVRETMSHFDRTHDASPSPRHAPVGHPPLGAAMVVLLLLGLLGLGVTGVVVLGGVEKQGPLAWAIRFTTGRLVKELHEGLALGLLGLIVIHVLGVIVESVLYRINLISTMIHGMKKVSQPDEIKKILSTPIALQPAVGWSLGLAIGLTGLVVFGLSQPVQGWTALAFLPDYRQECGACHDPYHPSLRSAQEWGQVMGQLDRHFGEDAGLAASKRDQIQKWLEENSAEHWDSKASWIIGRSPAADPAGAITQTKGWQRLHRHLDPALVKRPGIAQFSHCTACHRDADSGAFAAQALHIPAP